MPDANAVNARSSSVRTARLDRYSRVDLSRVRVIRAETDEEFEIVGRLRAAGFGRVSSAERCPQDWLDESDRRAGVRSLIGFDPMGEPVATMRVQDERESPLELGRLVPLNRLLPDEARPAAQFARLSVMKAATSPDVMFGIFKAAWRWCLREGLESIVLASPPWARPIYDFMLFEHLGPEGEFEHELAGGARHVTLCLPVSEAVDRWRQARHPLYPAFVEAEHPALSLA
jgi:hypothetical protein